VGQVVRQVPSLGAQTHSARAVGSRAGRASSGSVQRTSRDMEGQEGQGAELPGAATGTSWTAGKAGGQEVPHSAPRPGHARPGGGSQAAVAGSGGTGGQGEGRGGQAAIAAAASKGAGPLQEQQRQQQQSPQPPGPSIATLYEQAIAQARRKPPPPAQSGSNQQGAAGTAQGAVPSSQEASAGGSLLKSIMRGKSKQAAVSDWRHNRQVPGQWDLQPEIGFRQQDRPA
jgi:hypothetical protein